MAQNEIVNVLTIKTEESQRTIKGLKKEIADLKKILDNAVIGSEEFEQASRDLKVAQNELKAAMTGQKQSVEALDGSYDALVQEMAKLKKEWRATADVVKRDELGKQIDIINNQLKELDDTIGNNQRKVGAYAEEFGKAIAQNNNNVTASAELFKKALAKQDDATISTRTKLESVQKVTAGLASGYAAVQGTMALLGIENENLEKTFVKLQAAMAIAQGVGGMKDLVEGLSRGKVAFAGATNGVKMFIKGLSGVQKAIIGTGIGALVVAVGMLIANWEKISKLFSDTDPIEKTKKAIDSLNATYEVNDSLMKKTNDEAYLKYIENLKAVKGDADATAQVMKAYNQELKDNERQLLINNKLEAEFLQRQATTDFAIVKAAGFKESSKRYKEAQENLEKAVIAANKAQMALAAFEGKEIEEQAKATIEANKKKVESDKKAAEERAAVAKELAEKRKLFSKEIFESTLDDEQKQLLQLTEKYEEGKNLFKNNKEKLLELEEWYQNERIRIVLNGIDEEIDAEKAAQAEATAKKLANSEKSLDKKLAGIDSSTEMQIYTNERKKPSGNGEINAIDNELSKLLKLQDIFKEQRDLKVAAIEEEMKGFDVLSERWIELNNEKIRIAEQTNRTLGELSEQYNEQEKNRNRVLAGSITNTFTTALSSASAIIGALQEGIDTTNKEGFEKNKKMQIANATIQMLVGITSALAGAFTTKSGPWDIALAAIQAATIATTGGIQIAKIKQQTFDGGNSSITPSVSPNVSMDLPVSYTRNLMGNMETEEMNTAQKVYILESEIEEAGRKVEIRDNNTNF